MIEDKYIPYISGEAYHKGKSRGFLYGLCIGLVCGALGGWGWGVRSNILPLVESTQDYMINEVQNSRANFNDKLIDKREK